MPHKIIYYECTCCNSAYEIVNKFVKNRKEEESYGFNW